MELVQKTWEYQRRIEEFFRNIGKGRIGRVTKMARRPTSDEYSKVVFITGLGVLLIGAFGFFVYYVMTQWLPELWRILNP